MSPGENIVRSSWFRGEITSGRAVTIRANRTPTVQRAAEGVRLRGKPSLTASQAGILPAGGLPAWLRPRGSERLIRAAVQYAVRHKRRSVTLVHKGNIQKYTEGAFKTWGYALAKREFGDLTVGWEECGGRPPEGRLLIKDAITDAFLQQILTRPDEFDVIATTNLNGDYISDALAAQVGGIGIAPGANINYQDGHAIFEATHGTAPKYAGLDKVNPGSVILSGAMMFEHLGWVEAAGKITDAMSATIAQKRVTYDLARLMEGATELKCSQFATALIENM